MYLASTRLFLLACRYFVVGYYQGRYISAPEIAEKYNMNVRALMPALRQLTRTGILRSRVGGVERGFLFSQDPKDITMFDVISSLEGNNGVSCCKSVLSGLKCDCDGVNDCFIYNFLLRITDRVNSKLASITVEQFTRPISDRTKEII